jgi:hypothetical protein
MKLTSRQKKLWHSVLIGFATGSLTALQIALTTGLTEKKAVVAALVGAVVAGLARAIGAVLAWIETSDAPPAGPQP